MKLEKAKRTRLPSPLQMQPKDIVKLKCESATAQVHLHGATVISWEIDGKPLLFLSKKAILDGSRPIRGGIPLVFPQFGTGKIMSGQHGFARTVKWSLNSCTESSAEFSLCNSESTFELWPHKFELIYKVCLERDAILTSFSVNNVDDRDIEFTALLHTYFNIKDITSVKVTGLEGLTYVDKLRNNEAFKEARPLVSNISEEVDRNYFHVEKPIKLECSHGSFEISSDFNDLVVWNPWTEKSKAMADFEDDEYKSMICLEYGHVELPVILKAGDLWKRQQHIVYKH